MSSQAALREDGTVDISAGRRRAITGALLVGTLLSSLEVMVVGPAMPQVVAEFGGAGLYPWVFTAYVVCQTLTIPLYGALADRRGRRDTYLLGVTLFGVGSVACALSGSMEAVIASRAVQGFGAGALIALTVTIFGDLYPVAERTKMQGVFSLVWGVSALLGPLAGGLITQLVSWRGIFWINVLPGAIAAGMVGLLLPGWVGRDHGGVRTGGLGRLLRDPTQQAINLSGLALGAAMLGVIGYLPVQVQAVEGGTPLDAGLALIPLSLSWTLAANLAGRVLGRFGFRSLVRFGTACVALGTTVAAVWPVAWPGLLLFGIGMGFTISAYNVAAQEAAPRNLRGTATSLGLWTRSLGGAFVLPLLGWIAGIGMDATSFESIEGLDEGVARAFAVIAGFAWVAAVITFARFPPGSLSPRE